MPDPRFTKPWHGVPRDRIHWNPAVIEQACIGIAQKLGAEGALRARGIALESAALAFPRFARESATVVSF